MGFQRTYSVRGPTGILYLSDHRSLQERKSFPISFVTSFRPLTSKIETKRMYPEAITRNDAPAVAPLIQPRAKIRVHQLVYFAGVVYALLVALTIHCHEPWADEAQGWLLGRDASLAELWGKLLHYEGSPGLWQTLVHALIRLGLPYSAYNFISAILGLAAVYLLLRYAPLPLFVRIALPFTYYLCYQYAVIARSYALVAPILFAIAAIYPQAQRRPALTTLLLCLLAGVSVHGFLISACIWVTIYAPTILSWARLPTSDRLKLAISGIAYGAVLLFFMLCAWPAKNVAFAEHRGLSNLHWHVFQDVVRSNFSGAFTGYWLLSLALILLSFPFLWRGGGGLFFLLVSAGLCLFGTIVYAQVWHFGVLFLAWLFAIWISAYKTRVTAPTLLALIIAIGFQCYWSAAVIGYDWSHAYSGSLSAAQYLRQAGLPRGGLYAVGYPATALQPYFSANIYSDFQDGAPRAYWDWSKENTADDPGALFASDRRDLVLVGYKDTAEKKRWAGLLALLGYGIERHFDGGTFWQTGTFELQSFDLYRKTSDPRATSNVNMADPAQAAQLLNGFYSIEGGKWRWTSKNFSVLLKAPPGSQRSGAVLTLKLYIPDVQLHRSGAITLSADIGGHALPAETFSDSNEYAYSTHVAAEALQSGFVAVNFRLDKSAVNLNGDARELGVVVSAVSLDPAR